MSGIESRVPEGTYTRGMLAKKLGVSISTIKRMEANESISPSTHYEMGSLNVGLYTDNDLQDVRMALSRRVVGRPRTTAQR